jgi:hypothetical protein
MISIAAENAAPAPGKEKMMRLRFWFLDFILSCSNNKENVLEDMKCKKEFLKSMHYN